MSDTMTTEGVVVPVVANTPHPLPAYGTPDSAGLDLRPNSTPPSCSARRARPDPHRTAPPCRVDLKRRFAPEAASHTSTG